MRDYWGPAPSSSTYWGSPADDARVSPTTGPPDELFSRARAALLSRASWGRGQPFLNGAPQTMLRRLLVDHGDRVLEVIAELPAGELLIPTLVDELHMRLVVGDVDVDERHQVADLGGERLRWLDRLDAVDRLLATFVDSGDVDELDRLREERQQCENALQALDQGVAP